MKTIYLSADEVVQDRPFTHPNQIKADLNTLRFMVDQVRLLLEQTYWRNDQPRPVIVHRPRPENYVYRFVVAQPERLQQQEELTCVGFLGQRRPDADLALAQEFDALLIEEIPENPDLLSYSTMGLICGNYSNLVIFANETAKDDWGRSQAHAQAASRLAPDYYRTVRLYNGKLPAGLFDSRQLRLTRVKYYDYQQTPSWHAVREFTGST